MPRKLSAKKLLAKFPDAINTHNENCLQDFACPECGERGEFHIEMSSVIPMFDNGTDDHTDTEWDGKSYCRCGTCGHEAKVRNFQFKGLDDLIWQLRDDLGTTHEAAAAQPAL